MKEGKYSTIHYQSYLQLEKVLDAQELRSEKVDGKPAHEEMLFIISHQTYELWFKQINYELESIIKLFVDKKIDERNLGVVNNRLGRVAEIIKLMIQQIGVLETMTPLDFLDFRNYLFPASGFQSFQFRKIEVLLGLTSDSRVSYNNKHYTCPFASSQKSELTKGEEDDDSLFKVIKAWLERIPFLQSKDFNFLTEYKSAVARMVGKEQKAISESEYLTEEEKEMRLKMLGGTDTYFQIIFDEELHKKMEAEGKLKFSYQATIGALLINLYRDEPILQSPFFLLKQLTDIDELLSTWRYRHAQMVLRMLGKKIGTGGSSGYDYLLDTSLKHHIFSDLHNISTLLIPRSELPKLPAELSRNMDFHFSEKK